MRRLSLLVLLAGCQAPVVAADAVAPAVDATSPSLDAWTAADAWITPDAFASDAGVDANDSCIVDYDVGDCISTTSCAARSGYSSTPGHCPGAADIQCCSLTPDLSTNPPFPTGYRLMMQSEVTPEMTTWAVMILHDGATYPMFSTTTMTFAAAAGGTVVVLAQVEWHPPDFQNSVVHRGVTLFVPM